jgi:hypothetical protein
VKIDGRTAWRLSDQYSALPRITSFDLDVVRTFSHSRTPRNSIKYQFSIAGGTVDPERAYHQAEHEMEMALFANVKRKIDNPLQIPYRSNILSSSAVVTEIGAAVA